MHLTPDMTDRMDPKPSAYGVDILHFISMPGPSIINSHSELKQLTVREGEEKLSGARAFLPTVAKAPLVVATNRDPTFYEYGAKPSGDKSIYCTTHCGGKSVTPYDYMTIVDSLKPDLFVSMCDEITVSEAGKKRTTTSVKRTSEWNESCLSHMTSEQPMKALISIAGGRSEYDRTKSTISAVETYEKNKDKSIGFALSGFGTGEEPNDERQSLLNLVISSLPEEGLRSVAGISSPTEVLDAVRLGVDLFDNAYISSATRSGLALSFPISPDQVHASSSTTVNLWSMEYRLDKGPMVAGCECGACKKNSRGYVHHLLQVHEMLAEVLLEHHNTHHYLLFMAQIRKEIGAGTFEAYVSWFKDQAEKGSGGFTAEEENRGEKRKRQQELEDNQDSKKIRQ